MFSSCNNIRWKHHSNICVMQQRRSLTKQNHLQQLVVIFNIQQSIILIIDVHKQLRAGKNIFLCHININVLQRDTFRPNQSLHLYLFAFFLKLRISEDEIKLTTYGILILLHVYIHKSYLRTIYFHTLQQSLPH